MEKSTRMSMRGAAVAAVAAATLLAACGSTKTAAKAPTVTTVSAAPAVAVATTPAVTAAPTTKAPATTAAPTTPPAPTVVFQQAGSGQSTTASFHVNNEWQLAWTYDCSAFGSSGNFVVDISQPPGKVGIDVATNDQGVNQLGANGTGVEHYHYGGTIFFSIISECKWTVKVTQ